MDKDEIKRKARLREGANEAANERAKASIQKGIDELIRRLGEIDAGNALTEEEKHEQARLIRTTIKNWLAKWTNR